MRDFDLKKKDYGESEGRGEREPYQSLHERATRIQHLLDSFGIEYRTKKGGSFFYVTCPFHSGSGEKNFWIHAGGRTAKCHSGQCGHKTDWNGYAKQLGLPKLRVDGPGVNGESYLKDRLQRQRGNLQQVDPDDALDELRLPQGIKPWKGPWRGLTPEFLKRVRPFSWYDRWDKCDRILFPLTHDGRIVGFTSGRAEYDGTLKKGKHRTSFDLPTDRLFFFLDQLAPTPFLVLVEGYYGCLYAVQNGLPTTAIMGADNWKPEKTDILLMRPGLKRVFVLSDGDAGGDKMWKKAKSELKDHFPISRIKIPRGKDPGNMGPKWYRRLGAELRDLTGWDGEVAFTPFPRGLAA